MYLYTLYNCMYVNIYIYMHFCIYTNIHKGCTCYTNKQKCQQFAVCRTSTFKPCLDPTIYFPIISICLKTTCQGQNFNLHLRDEHKVNCTMIKSTRGIWVLCMCTNKHKQTYIASINEGSIYFKKSVQQQSHYSVYDQVDHTPKQKQ